MQQEIDLHQAFSTIDYVYFSGVSLSILDGTSLDHFYDALAQAKQSGAQIIFDPHSDLSLWRDTATAQSVMNRFLGLVDIALPSFSDVQNLYGDMDPADTVERFQALGVSEVVVKSGAEACLVSTPAARLWVPTQPVRAVDMSGAGEAFNAGYLAHRLSGRDEETSVRAGHTLAGAVIQHRGAIIPKSTMPKLTP